MNTKLDIKEPKIYFAGRIRKERKRFGINVDSTINDSDNLYAPRIAPVQGNGFKYTGPFTFGDDHGCSHRGFAGIEWRVSVPPEQADLPFYDFFGTSSHGATYDCCHSGYKEGKSIRQAVFQRAMFGIHEADYVFAWVDDDQCFGTLVEIGFARALGKKIFIGIPPHIEPRGELWFGLYAATLIFKADTVKEAVKQVLDHIMFEYHKKSGSAA